MHTQCYQHYNILLGISQFIADDRLGISQFIVDDRLGISQFITVCNLTTPDPIIISSPIVTINMICY